MGRGHSWRRSVFASCGAGWGRKSILVGNHRYQVKLTKDGFSATVIMDPQWKLNLKTIAKTSR